MSNERSISEEEIYHIRIKGYLDEKWSDWFDGFTITHPGESETLLSGSVSDQSALHGILAKIRDLGLTLISVEQIDKKVSPYSTSEEHHER
jgi:hypothetical protein